MNKNTMIISVAGSETQLKEKGMTSHKNVFFWALAEKLGGRQKGKGRADILSHWEFLQIHIF